MSSFSWRAPASLSVLLFLLSTLLVTSPASGQTAGHLPPVTAAVTDGFRPPTTPFGPGNRGLEYDTQPGTPVQASAAGEVVFAGDVAGSLHVTLLHADGVRTSYSYLQEVDVARGQQVDQGQPVGTAGEVLHFGARRGDEGYFDPSLLFAAEGSGAVEVELLPFEVRPGARADSERAALVQLAFDGSGGGGLPGFGDVAGWFTERVSLVQHYLTEIDPTRRLAGGLAGVAQRLAFPPACSDQPAPSRPVDGQARAALLVGGLGTTVDTASINDLRVDELGYAPGTTRRLSYDSEGDLRQAGEELADAVEQLARDSPPAARVDLYGHSMGGLVVRLGLEELERRGFDLRRVGLVTTFGSPHQGADLATAAVSGGIWSDVVAVRQMAETSPVIGDLASTGVPDGVEMLSLAASGDVVVAAPQTVVDGATNVTVGLVGREAHGDLVGHDEATAEVARALAGQAPRCEDPWEVVRENTTGEAISYVEDLAGFALLPTGG